MQPCGDIIIKIKPLNEISKQIVQKNLLKKFKKKKRVEFLEELTIENPSEEFVICEDLVNHLRKNWGIHDFELRFCSSYQKYLKFE